MKQTEKQMSMNVEKSMELAEHLLDIFADRHGGEVAFALAYASAIVMHDCEINPEDMIKTIRDLYNSYNPDESKTH